MSYRLLVSTFCCLLAFTSVSSATPPSSPLIDNYRRALLLDPDNPSLQYHLGNALLLAGENQQAIDSLSLAYPAYTESLDLHFNLAIAYLRTKDLDSALLYSERAEELGALDNPDLYPIVDIYYNLALAYEENDNFQEAERLFSRILLLDPARGEIHLLLGNLLARQERDSEALTAFEHYQSLYPGDPTIKEYLFPAYINLAMGHLEKSDYLQARIALDTARRTDPSSPLPPYYLGYLDYQGGNFDAAAEQLQAAQQRSPTPDQVENIDTMLYNCAVALLQANEPDAALRAITPLLASSPNAVKHYYLAGSSHLQKHDFVQARQAFNELLALDPTHREATAALAFISPRAVEQLVREGLALLDQAEPVAALSRLEAALTIDASSPAAQTAFQQAQKRLAAMVNQQLQAAQEAYAEGSLYEALQAVRTLLQLTPNDHRGIALQEQLLRSLDQKLENAFAGSKLALREGRLNDARELLRGLLQLAPEHRDGQDVLAEVRQLSQELGLQAVVRGQQALENDEPLAAEQAFSEALAFAPELTEARDGLAQSRERLDAVIAQEIQAGRQALSVGRYEEARKHYQRALTLRDTPAAQAGLAAVEEAFVAKTDALLSAAQKAVAGKNFQRARRIYDQLLSLVPQHPAARSGLIELEAQQDTESRRLVAVAHQALHNGILRTAIDHYRQVLEMDPGHGEARAGLQTGLERLKVELLKLVADGAEMLRQGDVPKAETTVRAALTIDPYNREAQGLLRTIEKIKTTAVDSGSAEKLYLQGIELYTQGKYEAAIKVWQQVILLAPDHEKARLNIDKAQRKIRSIGVYRNG